MSSKRKNENLTIAKNSLILYFRLITISIVSLISARYILKALGHSDYGLYAVVGGVVAMMAFLNNIMTSTTYRFVAYELGKGENGNVNKVFNISFALHFGLSVLTVIFAETIGVYYIKNYLNVVSARIPDALFIFRLSVISTVISIISIPFQGIITAKERFSVLASIEIMRSVLVLVVVVFLQNYIGDKLRLYTLLVSVVSILSSLLYYVYVKNKYPDFVRWHFQKDKMKYVEMMWFGIWILVGAAAAVSETYVSAIIINIFFGTVVNAAFGIASQVNNVIKMFAQSLNSTVIPQITKSYSSGESERTIELVVFSSKYSFFLMMIPALPILLETETLMDIWLLDVPEYTVIFVRLMILNALISTANAGIPAVVQAIGNIKYYQIILSSLTLIALPISYLLLSFGAKPYVMIIVFTAISFINLAVRQILLKRLVSFNTKDFIRKVYLRIAVVVLPLSLLFLVKDFFDESIIRFVVLSIISVILLLLLIYFAGMSKIEKKYINKFICEKVSFS